MRFMPQPDITAGDDFTVPAGPCRDVLAAPAIQARWLQAVAIAIAAAGLCLLFIRSGWWGPDDGAYALVASRILEGAVVHRDIQDIHPGYIHFINAGALALFGDDILSMRWPILALTSVHAALAGDILARRAGLLASVVGALTLVATGAIQFFNPTPNWYTLTLAIIIAWLLDRDGGQDRKTQFGVGLLIGLAFCFRQPTGVLIGIAACTFLALSAGVSRHPHKPTAAGLLFLALAAFLAVYLVRSASVTSILLFGTGPMAVLVWCALHVELRLAALLRMGSNLLAGALVSAVPLVIYQLYCGTVGQWAADVFVAPFTLIALPFFDRTSYLDLPLVAATALPNPIGVVHIVYWTLLLAAAPALSVVVFRGLSRGAPTAALPTIAMFSAVVSVHYEIPIYLYYSVGLSIAGLLSVPMAKIPRLAIAGCAAIVATIALTFHAGQPVGRGFFATAVGARVATTELGLRKASIRVTKSDHDLYRSMLRLIEACTPADETIFAYPSNSELYYLADKTPPVRFFSTAFGLKRTEDAGALAAMLASSAGPRMVIHNRLDKYNSRLSDRITQALVAPSFSLTSVGPFDVYYRSPAAAQCVAAAHIAGSHP